MLEAVFAAFPLEAAAAFSVCDAIRHDERLGGDLQTEPGNLPSG